MIFSSPIPFREALESRLVRALLPTDLRTDLLATIPSELRERAMFSAGVTDAEFLQRSSDLIDDLLEGRTNRAEARTALKEFMGTLGADVDETDLTDLRSDARLNLILDTNVAMAEGYGQWAQAQDPVALEEYPARELVRVRASRVERDWPSRWLEAGGTFYGNRMIALIDDPIWTAISRFGTPWAPFDFNSGMDTVPVDRDTAEDLGVIAPGAPAPRPRDRDFNTDLKVTPEVRDRSLRDALAEALQGVASFDAGGVLRISGGAP